MPLSFNCPLRKFGFRNKLSPFIKGSRVSTLLIKDSAVNLYCIMSKKKAFANEKQWQQTRLQSKNQTGSTM